MQSTVHIEDRGVSHILYTRGRLLDGVTTNDDEALQKLASIMRRTTTQIKERLLCGKRKKIKSSHSLEKLFRLKSKLERSGLDVYIELDTEHAEG